MLTQHEPNVYDVGGTSSAAQVLLTVLTECKFLSYIELWPLIQTHMGIREDQRTWYFPVSVVFVMCEIHISRVSLYDKFLIIRFERNTMETSLVHCLWHLFTRATHS